MRAKLYQLCTVSLDNTKHIKDIFPLKSSTVLPNIHNVHEKKKCIASQDIASSSETIKKLIL